MPSTDEIPAASLTGVLKRFGEQVALDHLTLGIRAGEVTALLGPNGAGKSTTISLLLGLIPPEAGEVRVLGERAGERAVRRRTGLAEAFVRLTREAA